MSATDHIDNKAIGRRLQIARDRYGITQLEAAKFAGMTLKRWCELERGDSTANWNYPTVRSVIKFVRRCGLSLDWIITGDERFAPEPPRRRPRLSVILGGAS
jgi:transcriptional regulator with XRE-family HTH domain